MISKSKVNHAKRIRFATFIRVSTEKQAEQGDSLRTQVTQLTNAVDSIVGGTITARYGGQEHATPGWEKEELDRLLCDATKPNRAFDAVMVAHPDRWSRDNAASQTGLELFVANGVRFFVQSAEQDLHDPQVRLMLAIHAAMGAYHAQNQSKKSIEVRIERAKRNIPTCGKLPFGRLWNSETGWSVDPEKQKMIQDVAKRYLSGETIMDLATEYGVNNSNLHKTLMQRCGTEWVQEFHVEKLKIHESVATTVPPLLSKSIIEAVKRKAQSNRTCHPNTSKNQYLLSGKVFCAHCDYRMFGQANHPDHRRHLYYRHAHAKRVRTCNHPTGWIDALELERNVMHYLFECFGNPQAVQRAIEAATPNRERIIELQARQIKLVEALAEKDKGIQRIVRLVGKGTIDEKDAEHELANLRDWKAKIEQEMARVMLGLENVPGPEAIKAISDQVHEGFEKWKLRRPMTSPRLVATVSGFNSDLAGMSWEDQRSLVERVFGGTTVDGKPMGVYITWSDNKIGNSSRPWRFTIDGQFIQQSDLLPMDEDRLSAFACYGAPHLQRSLVTKSALY